MAGKDAEAAAADPSPVTRPLHTEAMAPLRTSCLSPSPRTASSPAGGARLSLLLSELRLALRRVFERPFLSSSCSEQFPGGSPHPLAPCSGSAVCGSGTVRVSFSCWVWFILYQY